MKQTYLYLPPGNHLDHIVLPFSKEKMAEAVVSVVVQSLGHLLVTEANLLFGVNEEVVQISNELRMMKCFLKDADLRQNEDQMLRHWVGEIREMAYDVEDVVEIFVFKVESQRRGGMRNILKRYTCILNEAVARHKVGLKIQAIKTRVSDLTSRLQTYGIRELVEGEGSSSASEGRRLLRMSYPHVVDEDFVGLQQDVEKLVEKLVNENEQCLVVSIFGMGGLGKTTIAKKVYHHGRVRNHFDGFAWVFVSQQWQTRDILEGILIKLVLEKRDQIMKMGYVELLQQLCEILRRKKYLVVLDDIWSTEVWDSLRRVFSNEAGSKILLTTRSEKVAHVDPNGFLYRPRFLTEDESWELLQTKVFWNRDGEDSRNYTELENLGREMLRHCSGLPLAVVVLGAVLAARPPVPHEWMLVNNNVEMYLGEGKGHNQGYGVSEILALSYYDLPYKLKLCFLYLGKFPAEFEIPAQKLCQQWVAEGLVSLEEIEEEKACTDVAESYLHELAEKCMVQVRVKESTGRIKSCRLHDVMRKLCLSKAEEENFLNVVDFGHGNEKVEYTSWSKTRRLAFYLDPKVDTFVPPGKEISQNLRSALFFTPYGNIGGEFIPKLKSLLNNFKLLRVLDLGGSIYERLPKAIGKLYHLRYLSIKGSRMWRLTSAIGKLEYLQTLDLRVKNGVYSMPNEMWKMEQLRHLYLPNMIDQGRFRLDGFRDLEILVNFYSRGCDVKDDIFKLKKLQKLAATLILFDVKELESMVKYLTTTAELLRHSSLQFCYTAFCSEQEQKLLKELLECHHLYKLYLTGHIGKLPDGQYFSKNLTNLTLELSHLKEDPMATLQKVPMLRRLGLSSYAYVGKEMVCSRMGFPQLSSMNLFNLPNLEIWRVDEGAMPNLSTLTINSCHKLKMIPDGLRFLTSLQELEIMRMPKEFSNRLRLDNGEGGEDFYKIQHVPIIRIF
ncbi:hypothetical protein F0562_001499 [Nyssa sinensis]|uniref:AAA+ ATPase domain-containing protein n=1 Tax=Nyssa sinensis TaxID=561372 RepID=A0A5J5C3A2_9ASTE|nr:hypothetical protein F0562_001499 [Nyssa sinensis]